MIDPVIKNKIDKIVKRYSFVNVDYDLLCDALCVAVYEKKLEKGSKTNYQFNESKNPYRMLENIGDRVLKLVLSEYSYRHNAKDVKGINNFTNDKEKNEVLIALKLFDNNDIYCLEEGKVCQTRQNKEIIADITEAVIGAVYLSEKEKSGTFEQASSFIINYIINK